MSETDAQQDVQPKSLTIYLCEEPDCSKHYQSRRSLRKHVESLHRLKIRLCAEPGCSESFRSKEELLTHQRSNHETTIYFFCDRPLCSRSYKSQNSLDRHMSTDHDNPKVYTCDRPNCQKSYNQQGGLARHLRTEHERTEQSIPTEIYDILFKEGCKGLGSNGLYTCPCNKSTVKMRRAIGDHLLLSAESTSPEFVEMHRQIAIGLLEPVLRGQVATSDDTPAWTEDFAKRQADLMKISEEPMTWDDESQPAGASEFSLSPVTQQTEDNSDFASTTNSTPHDFEPGNLTTEPFGGVAELTVNDVPQCLDQDTTIDALGGGAWTAYDDAFRVQDDDWWMHSEMPVQESSGLTGDFNVPPPEPSTRTLVANLDDDLANMDWDMVTALQDDIDHMGQLVNEVFGYLGGIDTLMPTELEQFLGENL